MTTMTPRGQALHRAYRTRGISEQPPRSNTDRRKDGIRAWQIACAAGASWLIGKPWCGVRCYDLLKHAGVAGISSRLASVELIEEDAKARRAPFRGWTTDPASVLRGDLVVLFGRGIHVELVREVRADCLITEGGNTSSGVNGSQDNGGICARRVRYFHDVHGFALVDYPG
jgi:hypothetical protein